jgi:hypothetical protein
MKAKNHYIPDFQVYSSLEEITYDAEKSAMKPFTVNLERKVFTIPSNFEEICKRDKSTICTNFWLICVSLGLEPVTVNEVCNWKIQHSIREEQFVKAWCFSLQRGEIPPPPSSKNLLYRGVASFLKSRYNLLKGFNSAIAKFSNAENIITQLLGKDALRIYPVEYNLLSTMVYISRLVSLRDENLINWIYSPEYVRKTNGLNICHNVPVFTNQEQSFLDCYWNSLQMNDFDSLEYKTGLAYVNALNKYSIVMAKKCHNYKKVVKSLITRRTACVYSNLSKKELNKAKKTPIRELISKLDKNIKKDAFNPTLLLPLIGAKVHLAQSTNSDALDLLYANFKKESLPILESKIDFASNFMEEAFVSFLTSIQD